MSRTIDERIVEMRFDNRQFEQNVQTSLSTLDKLKRTYSSRVHSRLAGMYAVVQFRGRDIRLQKKQEG